MKIRASEIKNFLTCSQYLHFWLQGAEQKHSERVARAFEEGKLHEPAILEHAVKVLDLKNQQQQVEGEKEILGVILTATADMLASTAAGEKVVVEAKFLKARSIYNILNGENPYLYQVLSYLHIFEAKRGFLVMRNKDTPVYRNYEHHVVEVKSNKKLLKQAIEQIKRKAEEKPVKELSWKCSPTWCPYFHLCQPEISVLNEEMPELEELIASYKELQEQVSGIEGEKRRLRDAIVKILENKGLDYAETKAGTVRLKRSYRKALPDELLKQFEDKMVLKEIITLEVK